MMAADFFSKGIFAYYQGSLEFFVTENHLGILGGMAFDSNGCKLELPAPSYELLSSMDIFSFENHKRYYFYLWKQKGSMPNPKAYFLLKELEPDIFFSICDFHDESKILLGELSVDYSFSTEVQIAENAFHPLPNQIDTGHVIRLYFLPSPIDREMKRRISDIVMDFSRSAMKYYTQNHEEHFAMAASAFLHFSAFLVSGEYSPNTLYSVSEKYSEFLTTLLLDKVPENLENILKSIQNIFIEGKQNYRTSYYHADFNSDHEPYRPFMENLARLSEGLDMLNSRSSNLEDAHISENPFSIDDIDIAPIKDMNSALIVENDGSGHEANSTILLSSDGKKAILVGRGRKSGNDIIICTDDKTVSRVHLKLTPHRHGFFLEDLSSMGTYVDGEKIPKNVRKFITEKNKIELGKKGCLLDFNNPEYRSILKRIP